MVTRVLDWRARFDPKSLDYRIRTLNPSLPARTWRWKKHVQLDQGSEGACTGFAMAGVLADAPRPMSGIDDAFARQRYYRARHYDEWPGENYDGSSVLGAMQASKADGLIVSYYWAKTLDEILHAASYIAPVDIGIDWYRGMFNVDANGFVHAKEGVAGGHSLVVSGVDMAKNAVWIDNSWGPNWGIKGSALLSFEDLDMLRGHAGEFAVAKKAKVV